MTFVCRQLSSRPTKQELEAKHIIISELNVITIIIVVVVVVIGFVTRLFCETCTQLLNTTVMSWRQRLAIWLAVTDCF